jgi:hypothetical protein
MRARCKADSSGYTLPSLEIGSRAKCCRIVVPLRPVTVLLVRQGQVASFQPCPLCLGLKEYGRSLGIVLFLIFHGIRERLED